MSGADWTIVDTETTGITPPIRALEIAAQRMRGLMPVGAPFRVFLNHDVDVPPEAMSVHGYSRAFLQRNGQPPRQAHQSFAEYVGGTPVSAYNLHYDYDRVLVPEWTRLGFRPSIQRGFCILRLTRKLISPSPAGDYRLQSLRSHFRLPERAAHSALGDVLTVIDLFGSALSPRLQKLGLADAEAISGYLGGTGRPDRSGMQKSGSRREADGGRHVHDRPQWQARTNDPAGVGADRHPSQVRNETASSESNAPVTSDGRTHVPCPHCAKMLGIPKARSGTVLCPVCRKHFHADTR